MEYTEIIALIIVGISLFVFVRRILAKRKSNSCCDKKCPVSTGQLNKKDTDCKNPKETIT